MLVSGDKLVAVKKVAGVLNEGDIVKIIDVGEDGMISFAFGDGFMHMGLMNISECEEYFDKVKENVNNDFTTTEERVNWIIENSDISVSKVFDNCTVVSCRLPNGFVIVEYAACVNPKNYDEKMGVDICLDKITSKVWELEGYRRAEELHNSSSNLCNCGCDCDGEDYEEDDYEDEDLDCEDCEDYDCYNNPHRYR